MKSVWIIFKKEFKAYFNSPIAYIFITVFLVLLNWLYFRGFFIIRQADMRAFFGLLPWVYLFFIPALTMRLWAEEKREGTLELLMTMPIHDVSVILGKFLASFALLFLTILLTLSIPITLNQIGNIDKGQIIGQYIGALFLGGAMISIGLFISSLTHNQIISFIVTILISFILIIIGEPFIINLAPQSLVPLLRYISLSVHFDSLGRGVIDLRDVLYYISFIILFVYLNIKSIESRKW